MLTTSYPDSKNFFRGIFIYLLTEKLASKGHKITVIAPKFSVISSGNEIKNGVNIRRITYYNFERIFKFSELHPGSPEDILTIITFFLKVLMEGVKVLIKEKIDIIHVQWASVCGIVGIILGKIFNKPVVISVRGSDILIWPEYNKLLSLVIKTTVKLADKVMPISDIVNDKLINWGVNPEKIQICYRGVDTEIFRPQEKDSILLEKYDLKDKLVILFVGALIKRKNPQCLLKAFADISRENKYVRLIFIGTGILKKDIKDKVSELQIEDKVILPGGVKHSEIHRYCSICDIFVLPSFSEAMGTSLIEAMACKKPVIITETMGMAKVLKQIDAAVVVKSNNVKALKNGMLKLINDKKLKDRLSENAYKYILGNHTWKVELETTEKVYNQLNTKA